MIGADEYVEFLSREYLRGYVDEGGSAVKFVVADDFVASGFRDRVADEGRQSGYVVAAVDAATTRVHLDGARSSSRSPVRSTGTSSQ